MSEALNSPFATGWQMSKLTHFSGINFSLAISVKPETKIRKGKMKIDFHDTYAVVSVFFFFIEKGKLLWPSYLQYSWAADSNFSN